MFQMPTYPVMEVRSITSSVTNETSLHIYVNGTLYPEILYPDSNDFANGFQVEGNSKRLAFFFQSGFEIEINAGIFGFDYITTCPTDFFNLTYGLMGNCDGNADDDLRNKNNKLISPNAKQDIIHRDFGETWRISPSKSIFSPPLNIPENILQQWIPQFQINWPSVTAEQNARKICGNDQQCLYDISITQNDQVCMLEHKKPKMLLCV